MGILILVLVGFLLYFAITRESKPYIKRIVIQFLATMIGGMALSIIGNANFDGAWVGFVGLIGLISFYGSWGNLLHFMRNLPKKRG